MTRAASTTAYHLGDRLAPSTNDTAPALVSQLNTTNFCVYIWESKTWQSSPSYFVRSLVRILKLPIPAAGRPVSPSNRYYTLPGGAVCIPVRIVSHSATTVGGETSKARSHYPANLSKRALVSACVAICATSIIRGQVSQYSSLSAGSCQHQHTFISTSC